MSNSNFELRSLSLFERKEYEELKYRYSVEAQKLREKRVFLGVMIIAFLAITASAGVFH